MNLLAGSTGFLGNEILKAIGIQGIPTLALSRRPIVNLPSCDDELIIDFNAISELEIQKQEIKAANSATEAAATTFIDTEATQ